MYAITYLFTFILTSFENIHCRQHNHGRSRAEADKEYQHGKIGWCQGNHTTVLWSVPKNTTVEKQNLFINKLTDLFTCLPIFALDIAGTRKS